MPLAPRNVELVKHAKLKLKDNDEEMDVDAVGCYDADSGGCKTEAHEERELDGGS
jgi:hypothetical protein